MGIIIKNAAFNPSIVRDGLVLYLDAANIKSYNAGISTTAWNDLSGRANNANIGIGSTAAVYSTGNGGKFTFDGVNDMMTIPDSSSLTSLNNISFNFWVRPTAFQGGSYNSNTLIGKGSFNVGGGYGEYTVSINGTGVFFDLGPSGSPRINAAYTFTSNNWYNVCCTWDNGAADLYAKFRIYVNNQLLTNFNQYNFFSPTYADNSYPVSIGTICYDTTGTAFNGYHIGDIVVASIYNRTLTATEVSQNYNAIKGRFGI